MKLNAKLAKIIVDRNKDQHEIYVEESYALPWMYDYLEPHGMIMKLNNEKGALSEAVIQSDKEYWDDLCSQLHASDEFSMDIAAQKAFSKLRNGIANLYAHHGLQEQAEAAYRQSIALSPSNAMEPIYSLTQEYMKQGKQQEARDLVAKALSQHEGNKELTDQLTKFQKDLDEYLEAKSQ